MKPTILLVEDNKELLKVLSDELSYNYDVIKEMNGQQALNDLTNEAILLVVSDVMMPVMDGFELCKTIKTSFEYSHLPVILLTAKNTLQSRIEGLELGADAYIEKPFEMGHLQAQIANLLTNRKKIKDYFVQSPIAHLKSVAHSLSDESFLEKLNEAIQANIDDQDLDIDKLTRIMNMGRTSLYRKIKSLTDLAPTEFINITRLKKAADFLAQGDYRIYEVSNMVGFKSQTHFGRSFLKQFGVSPKDFQKSKHKGEQGLK